MVVAPSAPTAPSTAPSTALLPPSPPKMNPNEINQNGMEETLSGIVYMSDSDSFEDSSSDEFETTIAVPHLLHRPRPLFLLAMTLIPHLDLLAHPPYHAKMNLLR